MSVLKASCSVFDSTQDSAVAFPYVLSSRFEQSRAKADSPPKKYIDLNRISGYSMLFQGHPEPLGQM